MWKVVKHACWNCRKQRPCTCNAPHGTWRRKNGRYYHQLRHNRVALTTAEVAELLRHAGKADLMLTAMPVAPPAARPSRRRAAAWAHDALTYAYAAVVRENAQLRRFIRQQVPDHVVQAQVERVQEAVDKVYLPTTGDRPTQGFRGRLDGKGGRFRQNLMGKRCDFSARTVITGDPNLDIDQVGVPVSIAMRLTYPERVTNHNLRKMRAAVRRGTGELGGALYVERSDGQRFDLAFVASTALVADTLAVGDIVERMIVDDDVVIMNRQPSLHKASF